ncbi:MAG: hypothetical protein LUG23_09220 [Oscillospiraceae bacterium]|nr:hypothetical protein [Ruminococcus sp.]MCD7890070.1 hypothetical protein [Oscillospiraceae bacterium]
MVLIKLAIGLLFVLAVFLAVELINEHFCRKETTMKPQAEIRIYFESDCECFEWLVEKLKESGAVRDCKARLIVVDSVKTDESRKWLESLQKKMGNAFEIE